MLYAEGRPFNPVRDLNPLDEPQTDIQGGGSFHDTPQGITHTQELAQWIRDKQANRPDGQPNVVKLYQAKVYLQLNYANTHAEERVSKIAMCVKNEHPEWFKFKGSTVLSGLLPRIDSLNKNYDLE